MTDTQLKLAALERTKRETAQIILAEPERYAGIMNEWAQAVLRNQPNAFQT